MSRYLSVFLMMYCLAAYNLTAQNLNPDSTSRSIGLRLSPALLLPDTGKINIRGYESEFRLKISDFSWSAPVIPSDPFKLDTRTSSYYVPRDVRDELNLIMNRPRESAFVPVLGAAFLAYQIAQNYLFVRSKIHITPRDLIASKNHMQILKTLWGKSPQDVIDIYNRSNHISPTISAIEDELEILQDHKLVRSRKTESEKQYFPALSRSEFRNIILESQSDSTLNSEEKAILRSLLSGMD